MKNIINKYTAATSVIIGVLITFVFVCLAVPPTPPTVNITGNAATATSLASNPTDCAANAVATAIDAAGNLTCGYALNADIQAYDADLDTWAGITPSTDIQAFLGAANDTAARTELGLGSLATQNADNAIVTNLTANVIKTDTSADATLSGTPIIITVYDAASNTPYYFKAYPTK